MSGSVTAEQRGRGAPFWMIWANPIFRRYCRSRLRRRGLGAYLLVALIIAGFLFFIARSIAFHRVGFAIEDAERAPIIPLLVLQALILFFLGTGQVAGAMTAEADEGVLDYQRLAPMSPLAKVLGYLFGLPVREYVVCLATMPFTFWCVWRGEVPWHIAGMLYLAFFVAAILYHLTGLVAATVVKNRRWAFLVSIAAIFLLYTVVPQMAKIGLVYFRYITIWPVYDECLAHIIPKDLGAGLQSLNNLLPRATFFNLDLPEALFTVGTQLFLIVIGIVMLWRRWRRAESHLLGKVWGFGLFLWLQVLLLGNALPLIESGRIFPSKVVGSFGFRQNADWTPAGEEAVLICGIYGVVTLVMLWVITLMITPNKECQLRGWRRAHKLERRSLVPASDPSTSFWWVIAMGIAGAAGWWIFTRSVTESRWFPGFEIQQQVIFAFALAYATGALGFHALLEWRGIRTVALCAILVGVVPIMMGAIMAAIDNRLIGVAVWLAAISPLIAPFLAGEATISIANLPYEVFRALPRAFWFWQGVALLMTVVFVLRLWKARQEVAVMGRLST